MSYSSFQNLSVYKSADQSKSADSTLTNDSLLVFPILANEKWWFRVKAFVVAAVGGVRVGVNGPAAFSNLIYDVKIFNAGALLLASNYTVYDPANVGTAIGAIDLVTELEGVIENGVNPGTFAFRWGEFNSIGTATVERGSILFAKRIG